MHRICEEETANLQHLLHPPQSRTFSPDYYAALEERIQAFAARLLQRAAMFARARAISLVGAAHDVKHVTLCERDLNDAWQLIIQEDLDE